MISLTDVSFSFTDGSPLLREVCVSYSSGEISLVVGPTGSGKSTFLKLLNGLAPEFTGGSFSGSIRIDGTEIAGKKPHELSSLVAYVNQQAETAFVAETVREELAFGMEQLGFGAEAMHNRIHMVAQQLDLQDLLERSTTVLSGGEQQRVAIGAAIAAGAQILVLDEPTSELDADHAGEVLRLVASLAKNLGISVLIAEHRFDRLLEMLDTVTIIPGDGSVTKVPREGAVAAIQSIGRVSSPLLEIADILNWQPAPMTVAKARERWMLAPVQNLGWTQTSPEPTKTRRALLEISSLGVFQGLRQVVEVPRLSLRAGEVTGLIGANGSGKSSLIWAIAGLLPHTGSIQISGQPFGGKRKIATPQTMAVVPQTASDLLFEQTVTAEFEVGRFRQNITGAMIFFRDLVGDTHLKLHPKDLSAGQQLALVLALQATRQLELVLLDEPTRGLDHRAKQQLVAQVASLKASGCAVLIASHDYDFLAEVSQMCLRLEGGLVAEYGSAETVLTRTLEKAPIAWQVTREWLTASAVTA